MRSLLTLTFIATIFSMASAQNVKNPANAHTYAYITIEGKGFGKKLLVKVDLGDTPEQEKTGKEYSDILTNKKSFAAVLNYMEENDYELVESRDNSFSYQGTGGTSGIILIMRRKK